MRTTKAARPSSATKHIDIAVINRLLAAGLSRDAVANAVGCSGPNISQRVKAERQRKAAQARTTKRRTAETNDTATGRTATRTSDRG